MAPTLIFDLAACDLTREDFTIEQIEACNPQRGAMRHLDGVHFVRKVDGITEGLGYKRVRQDEFWVPGHIPGRPLLPGVLMLESAAQLSGFLMKQINPSVGFLGFVGADEVKFRGQVVPGDLLYMLSREIELKPRRFICQTQGVVNGNLVFEARIKGMPL